MEPVSCFCGSGMRAAPAGGAGQWAEDALTWGGSVPDLAVWLLGSRCGSGSRHVCRTEHPRCASPPSLLETAHAARGDSDLVNSDDLPG